MPEAPQLRLFGNVGVAREQVTTQHFISDMYVYQSEEQISFPKLAPHFRNG